jgi:hypothetical protein
VEFKNINDFYDLMDFCPLCHKRMRYTGEVLRNNKWRSKVNSKDLIILDEFGENLLRVNVNTNTVRSDCKDFLYDYAASECIVINIGRECKKYHFYYSGFLGIDVEKWTVEYLELRSVRLIKILDKTHFVVNNDFKYNSTEIRITSNFASREIKMKLNGCNLTRVKNINKKLNSILLLT